MNRCALAGGWFVFVTCSLAVADDKQAIQEIEGTYTVVKLLKDGMNAPDDFRKEMTLTIAGNELTFTIKDKKFPAKITKIDTTAKPAAIDISPSDGPEKGKTFLGIYRMEATGLTLAFVEKGQRPKDFNGDGEVVVMTLRKVAKKEKE